MNETSIFFICLAVIYCIFQYQEIKREENDTKIKVIELQFKHDSLLFEMQRAQIDSIKQIKSIK